jgi:hypothetical protein
MLLLHNKPPLAFRIVRAYVHPNIFEFDQKSFVNGEACILAQILAQSAFSPANLEKNNAFPRQTYTLGIRQLLAALMIGLS